MFWFEFGDRGLATVQEGKYFGVTGLRLSVREQLCTGVRTADVTVRVTAPSELAGARMLIDGTQRLGLSNGPQVQATVGGLPSGTHVIRIEKDGYDPIVKSYTYEPKEYWPEANVIEVNITPGEVRRTAVEAKAENSMSAANTRMTP